MNKGIGVEEEKLKDLMLKWQDILRLKDWDLRPVIVDRDWRKSGDVKIDTDNRMAALMIHWSTPPEHLEELVVHEMLHLKLYGMDQMIEHVLGILYGDDDDDPKKKFATGTFMLELESTVEDLTKALLTAHDGRRDFWFKRVDRQVLDELG
jgi:hypothetical protein